MPELPEVETVRAGLAPTLEGSRIEKVVLNRRDLRFDFPKGFAEALTGATITRARRRAKYLLFDLSTGMTWLSHLGMTGAYRFEDRALSEPSRKNKGDLTGTHDHVEMRLVRPDGTATTLIYSDPRRFGFMDLFENDHDSPYLKELGPEPLGNAFNAQELAEKFKKRRSPVKTALLDQRVVAGIGNIYASEALHRAHIHPDVEAAALVRADGKPRAELDDIAAAVKQVLIEAIEVGGSTLRDFRGADGQSGYFQHRFAVYDREGEPCLTPLCTGIVHRMVQSGRSTFFCPVCQKRLRGARKGRPKSPKARAKGD